jgi:HEPN domain-containing protein
MPINPHILGEVDSWMHKSREDLRAALVDLEAKPPILGDCMFHCQQACEKAIKALLCCMQTPFRRVHDLNELGALAMQSFPELDSSLEEIAHLSTYAVSTRYPSDEPEPEVNESRDNLALANRFVAEITDLLEKIKASRSG